MASVVFVNHLPEGSASSFRQEGFAKCLRSQGYDTTLVCRAENQPRPGTDKSQPGKLKGEGAYRRKIHWAEPFPFNLLENTRLLAAAVRDADIVHVNRANPYTATLLTMVRQSSRAAVVVDLEDWDGYGGYSSYIGSHGPKGWALTGFERVFPRTADAVVVVSTLLRDYMLRIGVPRERIFLVRNGYDGDLFRPDIDGEEVRRKYGLSDDPVVMYSSTFWEFERRQHEVAFAALRSIVTEVPDTRLILTGKESLDIGRALEAAGIGERAVRPGFVPRERVPQIMASADVAIHVISDHPFHRASSPMIIPEYMAMGKPVVAPRVGELEVLLDGGAGVLVDGIDKDMISGAAIRLLADEGLRRSVGNTAQRRARESYSYEVATSTLRQAYDRALS